MAFDLGIANPGSAGKQIKMDRQGITPRSMKKKTIADIPEETTSISGADYFGPVVSNDPGTNPLVINDAAGGRSSNVWGWAKAGLKKALGIAAVAPGVTSNAQAATIQNAASGPAVPSGIAILPDNIRGQSVKQNSDGSGTISPPARQIARKTVASSKRNAVTPSTATYSQPDEEGLRTTESIATSPTLPAGQRIFEMSGVDSAGMKNAQIADNGGIATMEGRTFVLPSRSAQEDQAFQGQLAQQQTTQPITAFAQPATIPTTTYGDAGGVYQLAPGQNPPPNANNMSFGDMAAYKFGLNQQVKQAGIANLNSEITSRGNKDSIAAAALPSQIDLNKANARHANVNADLGIYKAPAEVENIKATTDHTKAGTKEILEMMDPKKNAMLSDIKYKDGMLKIAGERLGLLKQQITLHAQQAAKGDATDWAGISKSALEAVKLLDAKAALGGLTPEDDQLRKNYIDTYNTAYVRQKRTSYQPRQVVADAGEE